MADGHRSYLPAAGHDWGLPLYDPLVKLLGGDKARLTLLDQADIPAAGRVLDVGCGTGTLIATVARTHRGISLVGLDPDPKALARAKRKIERTGAAVRLDRGFADALPYADASFTRVFSCFMLHHLPPRERLDALSEMRRVLEPGGSLHLLDFAPTPAGSGSGVARWLHSNHHLADNSEDRVIALMKEAGFAEAGAISRGALLLWHTTYYRATPRAAGGAAR